VRKVVHVSTGHRPRDARILGKEALSLARAGYEVSYLVPAAQSETVGGVGIVPLARPRGRLRRFTASTWGAWRAALQEKASVYHLHDPALIPAGLLLKLAGKRVIYDAHEDLTGQVLGKYWIPRPLRRVVSWCSGLMLGLAGRCFDGVVVARPQLARRFPARKTVVVENFPRLEEIAVAEAIPYPERPRWVYYAGGISVARGAVEMVEAMSLLPASLGAKLRLAGAPERESVLETMQQTPGWEHVAFLGWQNREQVAAELARARIGLVLLHPIPNYLGDGHPTKLMEYMAAGLPVIVTDLPLMRETVEEAGCGMVIPVQDAAALAEAIQWMLEHPEEAEARGRRGQQAVRERHNWDIEKRKLLELYARWA